MQRYQTVRRIIDRLVTDMIEAIGARIADERVRSLDDVPETPEPDPFRSPLARSLAGSLDRLGSRLR